MRSIHSALQPGGQLVLVELHREPGVTREGILEHVRADETTFTREIVADGFELVNRHAVPGLDEHYVLRFRRTQPPRRL
jgi:predicted methyltransferase